MLESAGPGAPHLGMSTRIRRGRVDKQISLKEGHTAVYERHVISSPINLGHHAILRFPGPSGSGKISTSRFVRREVVPARLEDPAQGGYSCLRLGSAFRSLEKVPTADGGYADLTEYPARHGYEDIALIVSDARQSFAWTAVTFPGEGYAWFALKDPRVLQETVFGFPTARRHYEPLSGRHADVLGLRK